MVRRRSCSAEQHGEIPVQLALEVRRQDGFLRHRRRRRGRQARLELVIEDPHETERTLLVENREKNVGAAWRLCFREKKLRIAASVQRRKGTALKLLSHFTTRRKDRGCQRTGGHDVERAREAVL